MAENEHTARCNYVKYQQDYTKNRAGMAASPDDHVHDPDSDNPEGLAEYKNPYSARSYTISEACEKLSHFCLERVNNTTRLKKRHNYYYQVQCQMFCDSKTWCDFVVNTEKDIHIE